MTWKPFLPRSPGSTVISSFRTNFCPEPTQESELPGTRAPLLPCVPAGTLDFGTGRAEPSPPARAGSPNSRDGDILISKVSGSIHGIFSPGESRVLPLFLLGDIPPEGLQDSPWSCWTRFTPSLPAAGSGCQAFPSFLRWRCLHLLLLVFLLSFIGFF